MELSKLKNLKEPFVLILIGPVLVGKSTFCKKFITDINDNVVIISRDECVMDVYGSKDYTEAFKNVDQKEVDKLLHNRLVDANKQKKNVIIDMTNLYSKRRKHNLDYFTNDFYKMGVIFPIITMEELEKRNEKRKKEENKFIPIHIIKNMLDSYQPIREDEGFDKVISL